MDEFSRHHGFQRLLFFSDAVFAIAITLLVLDIRLPPGATTLDFNQVWLEILAFLVSFGVIGRFWINHHALFEDVAGYNRQLLGVNLVLLAAVAFLPFPTSVVARLTPTTSSVTLYALSLAAVGALTILLTWTAQRQGLMRAGQTLGGTVRRMANTGAATLVFVLTALVAQGWPRPALLTLLLLAPAGRVGDFVGGRLERRIDRPAPTASEEGVTAT